MAGPAPRSTMTATPAIAGPLLEERVDRGQHRAACRGRVLDGEHGASGDVGPLDPALEAVLLLALAHDEGVEHLAAARRIVEHRGGDRIRPERQSPDSRVLPVRRELAHDGTHERCSNRVEGDAAQVDVVVGLATTGQDDPPPDDGLLDDLVPQGIPRVTGHARSLGCAAWRPEPCWCSPDASGALACRPWRPSSPCSCTPSTDRSPPSRLGCARPSRPTIRVLRWSSSSPGPWPACSPPIALSQRSSHRRVAEYVLLDPVLPPVTDGWPDAPVTVVVDDESADASVQGRLRGWTVLTSADFAAWTPAD